MTRPIDYNSRRRLVLRSSFLFSLSEFLVEFAHDIYISRINFFNCTRLGDKLCGRGRNFASIQIDVWR